MASKNEGKIKTLDNYNLGLEYYRKKDFKTALSYFEKVLEVIADDTPTKLYITRCKDYIENPPSEDWDGVYTMKTK
ncbi:MAG: tetratricopeptide repeat protein [Spirochaetota bacterium]|nr:tetratricopeptide repeat protein [Spirochaetota bacterium]